MMLSSKALDRNRRQQRRATTPLGSSRDVGLAVVASVPTGDASCAGVVMRLSPFSACPHFMRLFKVPVRR